MDNSSRQVAAISFTLASAVVACATSGNQAPGAGGEDGGGVDAAGGTMSSAGSPEGGSSSSLSGDSSSAGGNHASIDVGTSTPADAGAGTATADAADCVGNAASIHDDFESSSLSRWTLTDPFGNPLSANNTQYSVALDTTHTRNGSKWAVKVHDGLFGIAPPGPEFYGRVWQWFGSSPGDVPSGGHWGDIIGVGPPGAPGQARSEVRLGGQFGILMQNLGSNDDIVLSDPNFFNDGMSKGTRPIAGAWACVEFYFGKDSLRTWVNGLEITALAMTPATAWEHGTKAPWSPAYSSIRIGYANYNATLVDVWYDDVAIDTRRICCP